VTFWWTDDLRPAAGRPPISPSAPPAKAGLSGAIAALVILVLLGVLAIPVSSLARNGKSFWPAAWDARLAPIARRDVQIRGLKFKHPVPVRFLPEAAFKKLVAGSDGPDTGDRLEIARQAATFRALGLIGGKVDLFEATQQAQAAGNNLDSIVSAFNQATAAAVAQIANWTLNAAPPPPTMAQSPG